MDGQVRGKIVLGALPTIAPYFLPEIIRIFREKYPGAELILHEQTTDQLLRNLEENEIDLAIISDAPTNPNIQVQQLFSEQLLLCLPVHHTFVHQKSVVAPDLRQEQFTPTQHRHC